ncbi:hypothetical protein AN220_27950, partial [Streptomyces nanshensis]
LDRAGAGELIRRTAAEAKAVGGQVACGVGTDLLDPRAPDRDRPAASAETAAVVAAYEEQLELTEEAGAQAVLLASRGL